MFKELDAIVITHDMPEYGLRRGDIGTIVHCYKEGAAFEVEFVAANGRTIALLTLKQADIRSVSGQEVIHVRELEKVA